MKFLVDRMLGKLAKNLRALGYDTVYYRGKDPRQLTEMARQQGRTVLTRNIRLIPKQPGDNILTVEDDDPNLQLRSLIKRRVISDSVRAIQKVKTSLLDRNLSWTSQIVIPINPR